jgi:ABC-type phosphate/phosphonate transport system substrate-binding protein
MFTRRQFVNGLMASAFPGAMVSARCAESPFVIGIADFLILGQMKPDVAQTVVKSMADVFAIPGRPKPDFKIAAATELAGKLQKKEIHLAILTGIEYGWIHSKFPELLPLVTVFTTDIRLKACIIVPAESKVQNIKDLKGQTLALPKRLQHFPLLYLQQELLEEGCEPKNYFDRIVHSSDTDEGIEMVVDKGAAGVLVDVESWKGYQERKPGRAKKLKVIGESEPFPTAAVLYHPAVWGTEELKTLSTVLCSAHTRPFTRQLLNFWRMSKFIPYSDDYQKVVKGILAELPKPMEPFRP